jgi:four helix bundle protein
MSPQELRDRLEAFAVHADALAAPLLASPVTRNTADQLIRSSSSAASHHRAAGRARSHAEFTAKIGTALEEADEALAWVRHLVACGRVQVSDAEPLIAEAVELVKILTTSCRTAQRNEEARRTLERAQARRHRR